MNELEQMHCTAVNANTPLLADREITEYKSNLPEWRVYETEGELHLERAFTFKDFNQAVVFTNKVAQVANEEDHHPAILTEWGKVTVTWWTHKIRSLHLNDFIMAAKTDKLFGTKV
jgi:4a-hydroxytetrahydrobiopterin dehydratase